MSARASLPPDLKCKFEAVGQRLAKGEAVGETLDPAIAGLLELRPAIIASVAPQIAESARLFRHRERPFSFGDIFRQPLSDTAQLLGAPDLKYLFIFHFDGRLREAALRRLSEGLASPFLFAALCYRLNDWVEQVREAARESALRCFPKTAADVIAATAEILLLRLDSWGRWDGERDVIDAAFSRADVAASLADRLCEATVGPSARVLKQALRMPVMDLHLERLAVEARQPAVRALSLQSLAAGCATWQAGWQYKWTDKSLGKRVQVPRLEERPLEVDVEIDRILEAAARDRSVSVRRQCLDAIIRKQGSAVVGGSIARLLVEDRNPSIRERAAFVLNSNT